VTAALPFDDQPGLAERVEAAWAAVDAADPAAPGQPDAFEAVNTAILAELDRLEGL
jgi:hypothetical protein